MWRQLCGIQHLTFRFFSRLQGHFCLLGILRGGLCGEEALELLLSVSSFWRIPCVPVCWLGRPRVPVLRWLTFWRTLSVFLKCVLSNSGNGRFRLHACTSSGCGRASCPAGYFLANRVNSRYSRFTKRRNSKKKCERVGNACPVSRCGPYGSSRIHHRSLRFVSQVETLQSIIR